MKKNKKNVDVTFTGSGYCHNLSIGCDMECERCIFNKPYPKNQDELKQYQERVRR